jgi:hypothetical protein
VLPDKFQLFGLADQIVEARRGLPMSEQFTKADWRPSEKRATYVRERAWGGQKLAPTAFLAAAKLAGLNTNRALRCSRVAVSTGRPCRRVAMKGTTLCLCHGGAGVVRMFRDYVPTKSALRAKARARSG